MGTFFWVVDSGKTGAPRSLESKFCQKLSMSQGTRDQEGRMFFKEILKSLSIVLKFFISNSIHYIAEVHKNEILFKNDFVISFSVSVSTLHSFILF